MIKRLSLALSLALSACPTPSPAQTYGVVTLTSYHFDNDGQNQANAGLGVEQVVGDRLSVIAGEYRNSISRTSVYAGLAWTPLTVWNLHAGFAAGVVSGYERHPIAMAVPMVSLERPRYGANIFIAPSLRDTSGGVGFQFKVKF